MQENNGVGLFDIEIGENKRYEADGSGVERFLDVNQVAEFLGISRSSVYAFAKSGLLPRQKKFGRSSRWSLCELQKYAQTAPQGAYGQGGEK